MTDDLDKPYFTKNNLHTRFDSFDNNVIMLQGYLAAISLMMPRLKTLIEAAENFDDLKSHIITYINEQIEFRDHVDYLMKDDNAPWKDVQSLPTELQP